MRWEELSWDKVRRAQLRWSVGCEECSVKCWAWRVQCEVWSLEREGSSEKCEVWTVKCEVWTVKFGVRRVQCEVWTVKCGMWSVKCGVLRVQCEVKCWLRRVQCEECSVKCVVWSVKTVKCEVELQMWHVKQDTSFAECTHGLGWRMAHASSIDEKSLLYIYIFKATSAPPRAGTTGTGKCFVQALHYKVILGSALCKLCGTK